LTNWKNGLDIENNMVSSGVTFKGTGLIFNGTAGSSVRNELVNNYSWFIDGDIYSNREIAYSDLDFNIVVPSTSSFITAGNNYQIYYNGSPISSEVTYTSGDLNFPTVNIHVDGDLRGTLVLKNTTGDFTANTYYLDISQTICFKEDSRILCLVDDVEVYVPIQDIRIGDLVKTYLHGYKKVTVIGNGIIYNNGNDDARTKSRLYKYTVEEYPDLIEDLVLTGGHSILVNELTEEQKKVSLTYRKLLKKTDDKYLLLAVVDEKTIPYKENGIFTIYHITLEHENDLANYGIFANGLLVESCPKIHLLDKKYMTISE